MSKKNEYQVRVVRNQYHVIGFKVMARNENHATKLAQELANEVDDKEWFWKDESMDFYVEPLSSEGEQP
jgi:hypothetical protein